MLDVHAFFLVALRELELCLKNTACMASCEDYKLPTTYHRDAVGLSVRSLVQLAEPFPCPLAACTPLVPFPCRSTLGYLLYLSTVLDTLLIWRLALHSMLTRPKESVSPDPFEVHLIHSEFIQFIPLLFPSNHQ